MKSAPSAHTLPQKKITPPGNPKLNAKKATILISVTCDRSRFLFRPGIHKRIEARTEPNLGLYVVCLFGPKEVQNKLAT